MTLFRLIDKLTHWVAGYRLLRFSALSLVPTDEIASASLGSSALARSRPTRAASGSTRYARDQLDPPVSAITPPFERFHVDHCNRDRRLGVLPAEGLPAPR